MIKIIFTVLSYVLLFSTLICGLWIKSQTKVDPSSIQFHMNIAIATVVVVVITLILRK